MSRCDHCKWYWCGAGFIYSCHEDDARKLGKGDEDGQCPWFEEPTDSEGVATEDLYGFWNGDPHTSNY